MTWIKESMGSLTSNIEASLIDAKNKHSLKNDSTLIKKAFISQFSQIKFSFLEDFCKIQITKD
ncbi:hypothetical protein BpHYR1_045911 [Brachionus plicatilis]|uniref:Uncharacterized protein n=1 Tax=Brachionus plicatilis TaxID=10195 RepID=A0A3M7S775_BRAPC|nr:hypothetical protein BpHYR1_045911 [Brachionus plicatilis]